MRIYQLLILIGLSLFLSLAGTAIAQAPTPAPSPSAAPRLDEKLVKALRTGKIVLNFDAVDIRAMTRVMSELTGKSIVLDSKVAGTLTILSNRKVGIKEAWDIYVSALEASGYGVVDYGKYIKIMTLIEARKEDARYLGVKIPKVKSGYVVALVLMENADAELMANTLRPMMTTAGLVNAYTPANAVVITDAAANVARLTRIVRHLDANYRGNMLRVYQPKHVRVAELAKALQPLFATTAGATAGVDRQPKISAYEPTNTLLVMATERDFLQIESIMADIDSEDRVIKPEVRTFRVHYLQNADAEDVAKVVANMMEEKKRVIEEVKKEQAGTAEAKQTEAFISTKVSFDKSTNSLVFYATDREFEELRKMIVLLDAERKQVLVSAIIAEVSLKKLVEIGTRFHVATSSGVASFQGGLSLEQIYNTLAAGNFVVGGVSTTGTELTVGGTKLFYPGVFAILHMLETDNAFNVLSTPRLLTQDHKEANINVGQVIPFATGVKFDANGQPLVTYDYKDVGLNLKVTPHISQSNYVRMDVTQIVKDVTDYLRPNLGAVGYVVPIISNREIKTYITLGDNQTIIIGGLISNKTINVIKKVPFLNKLPLIGELFKDSSKTDERTSLFVFLTPHIINTPKDLQDITDKYGRVLHSEKAKNEKAPFIINEDKEETH